MKVKWLKWKTVKVRRSVLHFCLLFTFSSLSLSLSKLPAHIHSLFIFTTSFCLFPSSFYTTVTPTSCYHLWFVLLNSQACVSCCRSRFIVSFLSKFSFIFFSHLLSSPRFHSQGMKNFQYSHFALVGMELYSKHWSTSCRRSEKKKDIARTPESVESYRYWYFDKNGVSMCERPCPRPVLWDVLGQTHVNGWSRVITS